MLARILVQITKVLGIIIPDYISEKVGYTAPLEWQRDVFPAILCLH